MPPQRTRKNRNSGSGASTNTVVLQAPEITTPEKSTTQRGPAITVVQKQALIDNLQLEITERARKLRAQYALHAQGLRSRLEMRINRIPQSLRATNIDDLIKKYSEPTVLSKSKPILVFMAAPAEPASRVRSPVMEHSSPARTRGIKRTSHEMTGSSDKENVQIELDMPKKRTKMTVASSTATLVPPTTRGGRAASRKVDPSKVLSPKSHNSRQLPEPPLKAPTSPAKSYLARPISPIKPGTVALATASLASLVGPTESVRSVRGRPKAPPVSLANTGTVRSKRGVGAVMGPPVPPKNDRSRAISNSSANSNTSSGTTVVTKKKAPVKKGFVGKMTGIASAAGRRAVAKKDNAPPSSATGTVGRVLRSRT